jgi:hypothetical protein
MMNIAIQLSVRAMFEFLESGHAGLKLRQVRESRSAVCSKLHTGRWQGLCLHEAMLVPALTVPGISLTSLKLLTHSFPENGLTWGS